MDSSGQQAVAEALRRRAGLGGSSAGMGAPAANNQAPTNPIAAAGMTPPTSTPQGGMPPAPTAENPLAGAQSMLNSAMPNEATQIIKYMGDRLKKLPTGAETAPGGLMMP